MTKPKQVPQRTCVACRTRRPKWEMMRIVRTPLGEVEIDPRGKMSGRGAYLCKARSCWETGLKKNRLGYVLRVELTPEHRSRLSEYGKAFPMVLEGGNEPQSFS